MKALIVALALLLLIVHIWLSRQLHDGPNEKILTEAVQPGINQGFGDGVTVRYEYLDGILEGTVGSKAEVKDALARARELRPAGRIINRLKVVSKPASLFAGLADGKLTLRGMVPDAETKTALGEAAAELGKGEVINELVVKSNVGTPSWSAGMPAFMGRFFDGTDAGEIEATAKGLRLKRGVRSSATKKDLMDSTEQWKLPLVDQITMVRDRPGKLLAKLKGKVLTLTGQVPSESDKSAIEAEAKEAGYDVVNNLEVREDVLAPKWQLSGFMGDFFKDSSEAELEIDPSNIRVNRKVDKMRVKLAWLDRAKGLMPGAKLVDQIGFPEGPDFDFGFKRNGDRLKLSGWVPTMDLKDKLVASTKAKFPDMPIDDELYVQPNVKMPDWGLSMPGFMGKLPAWGGWDGFRFSPRGFDMAGMTDDAKRKFGFASGMFKGMPKMSIPAPPATDPAKVLAVLKDKVLKLSGRVPNAKLKSALEAEAKKALPGMTVINQINVDAAKVKVPRWSDSLSPMLGEFFASKVDGSELEIEPGKLRLKQTLPDKKARDSWVSKAKGFMPGKNGFVDQLSVRPPPAPKPSIPSTILAVLDGKKLKLTGKVPSEKLKDALAASAKKSIPGVKITNELKVDKEKVMVPQWSDKVGPLFTDFLANKPKAAEFEIGDKLRLKQVVANKAVKSSMVARAKSIMPGSDQFIDQLSIAPPPKPKPSDPARILAVLKDDALNITGQVSSDDMKKAIGAAAAKSLPKVKITNNLKVDSNKIKVPAWEKTVSPMLGDFFSSKPKAAEFEIDPDKLRLKQVVASDAAKNFLAGKARGMMPGSNRFIDQLSVAPPPPKPEPMKPKPIKPTKPSRVLAVLKDNAIRLSGQVPNSALKQSLQEAAAKAHPKAKITNDLAVDSKVKLPAWDAKVSEMMTEFLISSKSAEFEIDPDKLRLKQELVDQKAKQDWVAKATKFMPGKDRFIDQLSVRPPAPPKPVVMTKPEPKPDPKPEPPKEKPRQELKNYVIYFATNSSWINQKHQAELREAAEMIKNMEGKKTNILVKGYADARGNAASNKRLSERRAYSVVGTLTSLGVDRELIEVLAVGEAESNDSGAYKNDRRVEVKLVR